MFAKFAGPGRRSFKAGRWLAGLTIAGLATIGLAAGANAQSVTTYHGSADRSGLYIAPGLTWAAAANIHADAGFAGTISGNVYAQPLYWMPSGSTTGQVIVATESNTVYALDGDTGAVVWQRALGTPVTASALPCGNINPIGITGTPVIDEASGTLYLDAMVSIAGGAHHRIFALSLATGRVLPGWPVGVGEGMHLLGRPFDNPAQNQRSALAIVNGNLYVPYGADAGDCSTYHGTVVELTVGTPKITAAWTTRALGGGIWAQSGIAYDGQSMFVGTGNTRGTSVWADGEAVFRLQPGLAHSAAKADHFAPVHWADLDNRDLDLAGTGPIPVDIPAVGGTSLARVLALGKDGNAYLLDRADLGGLGGELEVRHVSSDEIISAAARFPTPTAAMVAFVGAGAACPNGQSGNLTMLRLSTDPVAVKTAWCQGFNGNGAPIVTTTDGSTDPIVWVVGAQGDNQLHGFRGTGGGAPLFSGGSLSGLQRNTTILVANGRFYVAGAGKVFAFTW